TGVGNTYIECDIEDYRIAHHLMSAILPSTLGKLPAGAERVLDEVRSLIESRSLRFDIPREKSGLHRENCESTADLDTNL
ncbi:hypothetical protein S1OALGB6SA_481, partial [Olavius algarvensis spirochete endosymbiont]|uniref:hypothetical protein n=1 Tax=Olavius algarvensis spirochete endosymbiont TaxID=260710 RepID=UPI000F2D41D3